MRLRIAGIPLRPALLAAVALMLVWLVSYSRLRDLSSDFFQPSVAGLRGLALYLGGKHAEAARAYRAGLGSGRLPDYESDLAGDLALQAGNRVRAEQRADTMLLLVPTAVEPRITLAHLALRDGRAADALHALRPVLESAPDHPDALYLAAVIHARLGDPGRAIDLLNRGLRMGTAGRRETLLWEVLELAGDLSTASEKPLCLLAHLYRYLRIFDERAGDLAIAYARAAIAAGDRPADAYLTLGIVHDKRGEHAEAMDALLKGTAADPRHAEAHRWAAVKAEARGDLLLEYRMTRAAFEAAPGDRFHHGRLEHVVMDKLGDPRTMVALMEQALAVDPKSAAAHERLARAAALAGDRTRARQHADRAVALRDGSDHAADEEESR